MIRKIRKDDYEMYMQMTKEFYDSNAVLHPVPESYRKAGWDELMRSGEYLQCYMIENDENNVVGYALISYTFSPEAGGKAMWLEELFIREKYRCQGYGKQFFAYAEKEIAPNVKRMRLEIEPDNDRARKLYQSMGYKSLDYAQMVKDM